MKTINLRIAIRVDASNAIGTGHVERCLTLANELRNRGCVVLFVSREHPGHMIEKLEANLYQVYRLPSSTKQLMKDSNDNYIDWLGVPQEQDAAETLSILAGEQYDWLVIDHYGLDVVWERLVRPSVKHILVIDDLANRDHDCDVLLDQNYFGNMTDFRYEHRVQNSCIRLLGPSYALLQPEYKQLRDILPPHDGHISRVLIFFGGSDLMNQTAKALLVFHHQDLAHLIIDVVIGVNHPDPKGIIAMVAERPATTIHQNLSSLAGLMARADLFVGAGGATTWERMSLGLPSLIISVAENQQQSTQALGDKGFQLSLASGTMASSAEWYDAMSQLIKEPAMVSKIAKQASKLVDGLGAKRILRVMYEYKIFTINIRRARPGDEAILLAWVNDPVTRKQSFEQDVISQIEHARWFATKLNNPNCILLIGEDEQGLPVGQVRFDVDRERSEALISISLEPLLRGKGLSKQLLNKALIQWKVIEPNMKVIAEVRDENQSSQRLFIKCQFTPTLSRRSGSKVFELVN